jgi:uncharacterized phage protein (TIGR02218 family)
MREVDPALQAELDSGATTLCLCWKLTRRDGVTLGFTDHDRPLAFAGVTYAAAAGFSASEAQAALGLAIDNQEIEGALSADTLEEAALQDGVFDGAEIEVWLVDWRDPSRRHLLRAAHLGEVRREGARFAAELRGLTHALNQEHGRIFQPGCDAVVGDHRCRVNLASAQFRGQGMVRAGSAGAAIAADGLGAFAAGWFAGGRLTATDGPAPGRAFEVRAHRIDPAQGFALLDLWTPASGALSPGVHFAVTAGCDRRLQTCREKFSNVANFRGFPHMPGNDRVLWYPRSGR